jgi:hypothetical protein
MSGTWRGACRPEHYNLDYNRFNKFEDDEEVTEKEDGISSMLKNPHLPPEMREAFRLSQIAKASGDMSAQKKADELVRQAINSGGPEIQKRFSETMKDMQKDPSWQKRAGAAGMDMPSPESFLQGDEATPVLQSKMKEKLQSTQKVLQDLAAKQASLEAIQSPEDMANFFASQGWTPEEIARAGQDEEYARKLMTEKMESLVPQDVDEGDLERMIREVESLASEVKKGGGDKPPVPAAAPSPPKPRALAATKVAKPAERASAPVRGAPSGEQDARRSAKDTSDVPATETADAVKIVTEAEQVVVTISLPGVASMAEIEVGFDAGVLVVNPVSAASFAPMKVKLPAGADTDACQAARFSKKRSELTVRLALR